MGRRRSTGGGRTAVSGGVPPRPMPGSDLRLEWVKSYARKGGGYGWERDLPGKGQGLVGWLTWEARASHKGLRTKVSEGRSRTPADRRCTSPEHTEECPESSTGRFTRLPRLEWPLKVQGLGAKAGLPFFGSEHPNPHSTTDHTSGCWCHCLCRGKGRRQFIRRESEEPHGRSRGWWAYGGS